MTSKKQLLIWIAVAVAASTLLLGVLFWEQRSMSTRWTSLWVGDPHVGAKLFFEKKGCAQCHPANGYGGNLAPDLGFARDPKSDMSNLVSAMWNCAPRMWESIRKKGMKFPSLNQEEMAHLFAFLYTARYLDQSGDKLRGAQLLRAKGCMYCHAVRGLGGDKGSDLSKVAGVDTPILWTQAMWNHAPKMEVLMREAGVAWPRFQGREMNDLLSYIRDVSSGPRRERSLLPASPERGWKLFQSKSCINCHVVSGKGGRVGPELGPGRPIPLTVIQFAGLMWNHSPEMWKAQSTRNISRPTFEGQEIADLVAFLASLRYFEPVGSAHMGKTIFVERDCGRCHGAAAEGDRQGPALRRRGRTYSTVALATALWSHGPNMYKRTKELKIPWPMLADSDVGNLISFLNSSLEDWR